MAERVPRVQADQGDVTEGAHPMTIADRIRAMTGRRDGRHRKTASRHRELDDTLAGIRRAATEAAQQSLEAIAHNDLREAQRLERIAVEFAARAASTEAAMARFEQDAPEVATDYGRQAPMPVPDSIDFSCPDCGMPLTAFRKRRMGKRYRGATYACPDCSMIWEVSWGAAGEDVQATAA
jgi:predicted RNA-binding Zn-ribbon protein involved in translation (DUF1610 family)